MIGQLPDRVRMAAALLPPVTDTSAPWLLDACTQFVDPWLARIALERGYVLVVCDREPGTPNVVQVDLAVPLPWADRQFRGVISTDTLEHLAEWTQAVAEFARITQPGGFLFFHVPIPGTYAHGFRPVTHPIEVNDESHDHRWAFGVDVVAAVERYGYRHVGGVYGNDDRVMRLNHLWIFERL